MGMIIAFILLVDLILIVAVSRLRVEEGWVGIVSVTWAFIIALYNVGTDRAVAWGKKEEEERLTGREETRRSLKEWLGVLTSTIIMVIIVIVGVLLTATLILRARDASLMAPGDHYYVDGDKYQVHLNCFGEVTHDVDGNPYPSLFIETNEDPFEYSFQPFIEEAYKNGSFSRYCYWDRPGYAFSDNAPSPHSAGMSVEALSEALAQAGEPGPWILVGAGFGGVHTRIFSSRHLSEIRGIVLIDAMHEDLLYRVGAPGTGFILWAYGVISPLGLDRIPPALFNGRTREDRVYGRSAYKGGKNIKAKLQENLVANSLTKTEVRQARTIQMTEVGRQVPLVIVSSGVECGKDAEWKNKQEDLTKITDNLVAWDVVSGAPHDVWRTAAGRRTLTKRLGDLVSA